MSDEQPIRRFSPALQSFIQAVRLFMRDHPQLNRLVAGEESSDAIIAWAVMDAVADFNGTPHFTQYTLEELIQLNQQPLLLRLTVVTLLESVGLLQTRNHLDYSNGGINVGVSNKTPMLMSWIQYFRGSAEQRKQQAKIALNIGSILGPGTGGVPSEYWAVNSSYLTY